MATVSRLGGEFHHTLLNTQQQEIRLVTVKCRGPGRPVECCIAHIDLELNREIQYAALSYCWGPNYPVHDILLNNRRFSVRSNLYNFLEGVATLHDAGEYRFWIDQLSIDQTNKDEKNHQVQHMATIFKQAREVIVWLGKAEKNSELIMNRLKKRIIPTGVIMESEVKSFAAFFSRPYWSRLWVVQEIVLARKVYLLCGDDYVLWSTVQDFYESKPSQELVANVFPKLSEGTKPLRTVHNFFLNHGDAAKVLACRPQRWPGEACLYLLDALTAFHNHECQDPRDKVYGVLGIVIPEDVANFPIDYTKDTREVFVDAAERTISTNMETWRTSIPLDVLQKLILLGRSMGVFRCGTKYEDATLHGLASIRCQSVSMNLQVDIPRPRALWHPVRNYELANYELVPRHRRLDQNLITEDEYVEGTRSLRAAILFILGYQTTQALPDLRSKQPSRHAACNAEVPQRC